MLVSLDALAAELRDHDPQAVSGCYTLATLAQLVQSLGQQAFAQAGGMLLVGDGNQQRDWPELALRETVPSSLIALPLPPDAGLLICGVGRLSGFCLVAQVLADPPAEDSARLFDVVWSCAPTAIRSLCAAVGVEQLPAAEQAQLANISAPDGAALLHVIDQLLSFAARQHDTFAVSSKALNERLRNHEDQTRMIVHDMRAPLHTLLISIKALQRQRYDSEGQNELLSVAKDSATYLLNLTETVLDSARLETSSWSLSLKPIRIATLIQSVCEPLELAPRPQQARLRRQVDDNLPVVHLDRGLIERVLTNLITNAIKFTPSAGEVTVSARLTDDRLSIELVVRDTGSGIAPDAIGQIFDRYYTGGGRVRGTGLGLYFCRLAVEAHGGNIDVESTLGQGSAFTVRLPLSEDG
jgi:signal transduction histidine kinase